MFERTMVYRCPGTLSRANGSYDYRAIDDEADLAGALADGWHETLPQAIEALNVNGEAAPAAISTGIIHSYEHPELGLRDDGPTVGEWVEGGYDALDYPPEGYLVLSTTREIYAAILQQIAEREPADEPPTREELEAQATELGVQFDGRTSDAKLQERIDEALQA